MLLRSSCIRGELIHSHEAACVGAVPGGRRCDNGSLMDLRVEPAALHTVIASDTR
jgi:hypothetical protein